MCFPVLANPVPYLEYEVRLLSWSKPFLISDLICEYKKIIPSYIALLYYIYCSFLASLRSSNRNRNEYDFSSWINMTLYGRISSK